MKIQDIIYEDVGQAISQAVVGAADAVLDIFDMPPTQRQQAVNDMVNQWDKEWPKIVSKDPDAKKSYGLALQS